MKAHDLICNVFFLLVIYICIFPHTCIQPRAFQLAELLTHRIQWITSTFITSLWCTNFPPICCGVRACVYMFTCVWGTSVCVHVHAYGGPSEVFPAFFKSTAALLDFVFSPRQSPQQHRILSALGAWEPHTPGYPARDQWLRTLTAPTEDLRLAPSTFVWTLTNTSKTISRWSDTLFWTPLLLTYVRTLPTGRDIHIS